MKKIEQCSYTFTLFLLVSLIITGCISARSDIRYGPTGPVVGRQTLKQIEKGYTSREWLLSVLGEPTEKSGTPDGTEIFKYHYTKRIDSHFEIDPVLNLGDKKEEHTTLYFEIREGIVMNFWKDK